MKVRPTTVLWLLLGLALVASAIVLFWPHSDQPTGAIIQRPRFFGGGRSDIASQTHPAYSVRQVVQNAGQYNGQSLCLTGYFQHAYELNALSASANLQNFTVTGPLVWLSVGIPTFSLQCQAGDHNTRSCFGQMTVCGKFQYNQQGGYGPSGEYKYQMSLS